MITAPVITDCHFHLFGPAARYPTQKAALYVPEDTTPDMANALFRALGVTRAVVIQPSVYGFDNRCQLEGAARLGMPTRAVVALPVDTDEATLIELHCQGARGVRFSLALSGAPLADGFERFAGRLAGLGWHVQMFINAQQLGELGPRLSRLPCPVVIDHLGLTEPRGGINHPGFQALLALVGANGWVKLSAGYRVTDSPAPYADLMPYVHALVAARPDRLLWGTDWPHVHIPQSIDTRLMLSQMDLWVPDAKVRARIFQDNPTTLYGF